VENLAVHHLSPSPEKYWSMMAYNNAKLCNVLFAQELAQVSHAQVWLDSGQLDTLSQPFFQRWKQRGISVFSVHPGNMVSTDISRNYWFYRLLFAIVRPFTKSHTNIPSPAKPTGLCPLRPTIAKRVLIGIAGWHSRL